MNEDLNYETVNEYLKYERINYSLTSFVNIIKPPNIVNIETCKKLFMNATEYIRRYDLVKILVNNKNLSELLSPHQLCVIFFSLKYSVICDLKAKLKSLNKYDEIRDIIKNRINKLENINLPSS